MQGTFELTHRDARGLRDADFRAALRRGEADALLRGLPLLGGYRARNLVFDNFAAFLFSQLMGGPDVTDPFDLGGTAAAALGIVTLMTTASEPTYEELATGYYETMYTQAETAGGGGKRFVEDVIETTRIAVAGDGRESVECRSRWLFLPSEGVSSDIRSVGIHFAADADSVAGYVSRARICRVRIKDAAGRAVIINKTASQVLLIEYTLKLVTI
jgi:hypothetical protein